MQINDEIWMRTYRLACSIAWRYYGSWMTSHVYDLDDLAVPAAIYAIEKLLQMDKQITSFDDVSGYVYWQLRKKMTLIARHDAIIRKYAVLGSQLIQNYYPDELKKI